ncbi:MAG: SulP family inorganic anion transporter, partial [Chitinophagaceae bacterium]
YIFAAVIVAGIIQIIAAFLRLGKFIRLVPHPVMFGFVNGLAIIIFLAQLTQFQEKDASGELHWMSGQALYIMTGLVLLSMLVIWGLPKLTKAFPSSLAAVLLISALVIGLNIDTKTVGDLAEIKGTFPPFHIPLVPFSIETLMIILPYSAIVAGVGLIESLLTLTLIDEITGTRGRSNKEAIAQGTANFITGFFSGMGGCALIGQSLINISAGARARLSSIVAAVMLLIFVVFGSAFIGRIPMAALTGLMIMVAIGTFEWASFRMIGKMPIHDILVGVLVAGIVVLSENLALAVLIGVIISALVFAWESAKRISAKNYIDKEQVKHYEIYGPLFFGSVTGFKRLFDVSGDPPEVIIDFKDSRIADMSGIEAINSLTEKYRLQNKTLRLRHLSPDSVTLLNKASSIIEVNIIEDPQYKVMTNQSD